MKTEALTPDMIKQLRDEAAAAGDDDTVVICGAAWHNSQTAREMVAKMINANRAMSDSAKIEVVA